MQFRILYRTAKPSRRSGWALSAKQTAPVASTTVTKQRERPKTAPPLIAVDVGNNRIKLGRFAGPVGSALRDPDSVLQLSGDELQVERLSAWLDQQAGSAAWWIGSVNRPTTSRLVDWLRANRPADRVTLLACGDLPLEVRLERPDMVGIDRLLDAVAANHLRQPSRPAVVVDMGTAITVDLVSADGAFCGGAIAAGISTSARALHAFTDLLPLIDVSELTQAPPALGVSTIDAMRSGLFYGALGVIRELVGRLTAGFSAAPQVFLTGGAGPAVAGLLGPDAQHVPNLTLSGIALVAAAGLRRE
jgi:type III pantothenate kinase